MVYNGKELRKEDYCMCQNCSAITSHEDEFGYWDVCCDCGKPIEDGFHYYNHYDGEDHDVDLY